MVNSAKILDKAKKIVYNNYMYHNSLKGEKK